jgi:hypothetical protein
VSRARFSLRCEPRLLAALPSRVLLFFDNSIQLENSRNAFRHHAPLGNPQSQFFWPLAAHF